MLSYKRVGYLFFGFLEFHILPISGKEIELARDQVIEPNNLFNFFIYFFLFKINFPFKL